MGTGESTGNKFELAVQLEQMAADTYDLIAQRFSEDEAAKKIFLRLAGEERQHAARVELLKSRFLYNRNAFREILVDVKVAEALLEEGQKLKEVLAGSTPITLHEAKKIMLAIEERFEIVHAQSMTANSDPEVRELFELLAKQDRQHIELLRDFSGR